LAGKRAKKRPSSKADPSSVRRTPAEEKRLKQTYGISEDDYQAMLKAQGGVCAICERHQRYQRLCVDHCHKTNKVRGLLCTRCNRNIGRFYDSVRLLRRAADYLEGSLVSSFSG
jgi:hypothetical protein